MNAAYTPMAKGFADEPAREVVDSTPPPPPPKRDDRFRDATPPVGMSSLGLDIPLSPTSPSPPSSAVEKTRKYSLLADLMESERTYVELLTGIIRKIAAAWSRSNLPPPELDVMFRSVEGVYKLNRALLAKLKELGENPSSPKALGDLLMRWIDELEKPYMTYADKYCIGFDDWEPVKTNPKVSIVLQTFSASNPPASTLPQPAHLPDPSCWTLDALFLLPKGRLQYYRKLYSKLLKGTVPGRSDHRLLTGALGKLDGLLATLDERADTAVYIPKSHHAQLPRVDMEANPLPPIPVESLANISTETATLLSGHFGADPASAATSMRGSFSSRDERLSQETALTSDSRESSQPTISSVLDLEKRLATETTLDLFTMQPKQIRLQIVSPNLPYTRELRISAKVVVRFIPKTTGVEVIHPRGHVYILSDLFLICEEMSRDERVSRAEDGKDMRLCYPPLSGKVLSVNEVVGQENAVQVSIMRREALILETSSRAQRDQFIDEFRECISFAKTISRAAQEPVPPLPPNLPQSSATHPKASDDFSRERPERALKPQSQVSSQSSGVQSQPSKPATPIDRALTVSSPTQDNDLLVASSRTYPEQKEVYFTQQEATHDSLRDVAGSPQSSPASPLQRVLTLQNSGPIYPPRVSSSRRTNNSPPSSFAPGQIVPLLRSTSVQSQSTPFTMPTSEPPGGQNHLQSPPITQNPAPQNPNLRHHASMHSLRHQPLQHQPSLHSLPHRSNHPNIPPTSQPRPGPHPFNGQPYPKLPPIPQLDTQSFHRLQKSQSSRSLHSHYQHANTPLPPIPSLPDGMPAPQRPYSQRKDSMGSMNSPRLKPLLPSMQMSSRANSIIEPSILDPSPPTSPVEERKPLEPVRSVITTEAKCKVFHKQHHAQWKSLGSANLTLYSQEPTNVKQLVVTSNNKEKSTLISTIVLTSGVERVGKTGVAIELSDTGGARTGIIYMIQLRDEETAGKLFRALLAGSDRAA